MTEKAAENVPLGDIISIANQRQHLAIFSDIQQTFFWFGAGEEPAGYATARKSICKRNVKNPRMPTQAHDYVPANLLIASDSINQTRFRTRLRRVLLAHATSPEYELNCTTLFTYRAAPAPEPLYARTAFQTSY